MCLWCRLSQAEAAAVRREARQAAQLRRAQEGRDKAARLAAAELARLADSAATAHQASASLPVGTMSPATMVCLRFA